MYISEQFSIFVKNIVNNRKYTHMKRTTMNQIRLFIKNYIDFGEITGIKYTNKVIFCNGNIYINAYNKTPGLNTCIKHFLPNPELLVELFEYKNNNTILMNSKSKDIYINKACKYLLYLKNIEKS